MKRVWMPLGAALILGGCATVEMAQYKVTSFPEVPLSASEKKPAKLKFVSKDQSLDGVVSALTAEFGKQKSYKVVSEEADYWFILSGSEQYAKGLPHNKISVKVQESQNGGEDVVAKESIQTASAAKIMSVAVYETKTLAPVHYFEIPLYNGEAAASVKSETEYAATFTRDVVERFMDVFVQQNKDVEIPIPLEADVALRKAFAAKDYSKFKTAPVDLKKLCSAIAAVEAGTADEAKKALAKDAEKKFGDYHLYLLAKEAQTMDVEELKSILDEQLTIIEKTDAAGLAEACPVALARLEYKLANLGE